MKIKTTVNVNIKWEGDRMLTNGELVGYVYLLGADYEVRFCGARGLYPTRTEAKFAAHKFFITWIAGKK
jgi:hypothetical protein